jgi:hypothetical protein
MEQRTMEAIAKKTLNCKCRLPYTFTNYASCIYKSSQAKIPKKIV